MGLCLILKKFLGFISIPFVHHNGPKSSTHLIQLMKFCCLLGHYFRHFSKNIFQTPADLSHCSQPESFQGSRYNGNNLQMFQSNDIKLFYLYFPL
jgi:hypothetical protein